MNGRKLILGALAAFVAMFVVSGLWHELLLGEFYTSNTPAGGRETPLFWSVGLGYLVLALLMAWIYPKGFEGRSPLDEGLRFGAIIGLIWWLPTNLVLYGALEGTFSLVVVDSAWHIVKQAVGGALIGLIYGRIKEPSEEKIEAT